MRRKVWDPAREGDRRGLFVGGEGFDTGAPFGEMGYGLVVRGDHSSAGSGGPGSNCVPERPAGGGARLTGQHQVGRAGCV
jgi:hypothetical protein